MCYRLQDLAANLGLVLHMHALIPHVRGRREHAWVFVQILVAVVGIVCALLALRMEDVVLCFGGSICMEHWGIWMVAPTGFWSCVATLAQMGWFGRTSFHMAYDLFRLIALSSFTAFVLISWRTSQTGNPLHVTLAVTMQLQAALSLRAASATRKRSGFGSGLFGSLLTEMDPASAVAGRALPLTRQKSRSLPRGWRMREDPEGRPYFENKKTGQRQWTIPGSDGLEWDEGESTCCSEHRAGSVL
jgi:hypothetical protein